MEFWGVEVKAGQPLKVKPTFDNIIHVSQASLGESKKEKVYESVPLYVKFGDKKLVLGTLIPENIPQLSFDLVFEKEFELSHNWKNGSVFFCGYQTPLLQDSSDEFDMEDSDEEGEEAPAVLAAENGQAGPKTEKAKIERAKAAIPKEDAAKPAAPKANAAKPAIPIKVVKPEEDDDDDEDDSDDEMIDGNDSDEISGEDDDSDDDDEDESEDDDSDEEEETPKKAEVGKKRSTESAPKTPRTDGKKGGHIVTPHPSRVLKHLLQRHRLPNLVDNTLVHPAARHLTVAMLYSLIQRLSTLENRGLTL